MSVEKSRFESINKYKQINQERNISNESVIVNGAVGSIAESKLYKSSIFNVSTGTTNSGSTGVSSNLSKVQKLAVTNSLVSGLAVAGMNIFAQIDSGKSVFVSLDSSTPKANKIETIEISNDLADAVENYSKKSNDKHSAKLDVELANANSDYAKLTAFSADQNAVIKAQEPIEKALTAEINDLKESKKSTQASVDKLNDAKSKEARNGVIEKTEIPAQEGVISASVAKVEAAQAKFTATESAQNAIISKETPNLQAMKTETVTNADGTTSTKQVPDEAKRADAKAKIDAAKKEIERAKGELVGTLKSEVGSADGKEITENSVQGKAKKTIEGLKKEITDNQKVIKEVGYTAVALEEAIKANQEIINKINTKSDELKAVKDVVTTATQKRDKADLDAKSLSAMIQRANELKKGNKVQEPEKK